MSTIVTTAKDLLRSPADRIALDDLVTEQVGLLLERTNRREFPLDARPIDNATVKSRIDAYEVAVSDLAIIVALIARWGTAENIPSLMQVFTQVGDANDDASGINAWIALAWLPFFALEYCAGIAAISAQRYEVLATIYAAQAGKRSRSGDPAGAVSRAVARMGEVDRNGTFKLLSDFKRRKTPASDYLLTYVERQLSGVIPLRSELESLFDRFEVMDTISNYSRQTEEKRVWSPPGRFLWKAENFDGGPLTHLQVEARSQGDYWLPSRAGLFNGSAAHFVDLVDKYRAEYVARAW